MSKAAQLEIVTPEIAPGTVKKLRVLAEDLKQSYSATVEKYFNLCVYIREAQISPDVLTAELRGLEFADSRISEIKRVSFSTEEIFEEYRSKAIGFKLALQKARAAEADKPENQALAEVPDEKTPLDQLRQDLKDAFDEYLLAVDGSKVGKVDWTFDAPYGQFVVRFAKAKVKKSGK